MQNLMITSCLAVVASASLYSGPGLATWPSSAGYGVQSTVWGAHGYRIGKRSAEPFYGYGAVGTLQNNNNVFGHQLGSGYAINQPHPGAAGSHQQVSRLHSGYGKRSAEPYGYGIAATIQNENNVWGHQLGSGYAINQPHPGFSGSYQQVSRLHSGYGKRSAEPFYGQGVATGLATWPSAAGYGVQSTVYGAHGYRIGKRSAEPFYGYGAVGTLQNNNNVFGHQLGSGYAINQPHPGFSGSYQQVSRLHSGYGKRSAEPFYGLGAVGTLQNNNNVFGHQLGSGYAINQPHPGFSGSYQQVSRLHSGYGKRSAEPFYGLGAVGTLQNNNNLFGHQYGSQYAISQPHPGHAGSFQQVSRIHSGYLY